MNPLPVQPIARDSPPEKSYAAQSLTPLLRRICALVFLFALELLVLSIWLDNDALAGGAGLAGAIHRWGAWAVRVVVGFAGLFATSAFLRKPALLESISTSMAASQIRLGLLCMHLVSIGIFAGLSHFLYTNCCDTALTSNALAVLWLAAGLAAIWFGAAAFIPASAWVRLFRETGLLWLAVLLVVVVACIAGNAIRSLWEPSARLTLTLVQMMIEPFLRGVIVDPSQMLIGTERFSVIIAPQCSGLEGIALILAFTALWLVLFRKECRFPNALVLLPAGVVIMYLLNAARIAALIAIGDAGAERVALGGFHSQAGWIAFNAVALGFALSASRIPWLSNASARQTRTEAFAWNQNLTAAFLMPLILTLAAGMLCTAVSSGFDWLYSLRLLVASAVLWFYRKEYAGLGWRGTWFGPVAGAIVFIVWIGFDRLSHTGSSAMPPALAAASSSARSLWIGGRILAAVTTVPLAEELAFRGYLLRRFIRADFQALSLQRFTWPALIASSVLFGLLHGGQWIAGIIAGLMYAAASLRRGRIADAVLAHATTNALLAAYVLLFGAWQLW
jgi:exosortase E/protease (VPEID-CTERM system)